MKHPRLALSKFPNKISIPSPPQKNTVRLLDAFFGRRPIWSIRDIYSMWTIPDSVDDFIGLLDDMNNEIMSTFLRCHDQLSTGLSMHVP